MAQTATQKILASYVCHEWTISMWLIAYLFGLVTFGSVYIPLTIF